MQAFTEVVPPTAVTSAIAAPFVDAGATNLLVAKTTLLQIFDIKTISNQAHQVLTSGQVAETAAHPDAGPSTLAGQRLSLVGEYALAGAINTLASAKLAHSKSGGHTLLIAHKNAKFSLIQWDPQIHGLATISVHYFERQDELGATWVSDLACFASRLTVDPQDRCAAYLHGQRSLAILPFLQGDEVVVEDADAGNDDASKAKKSGKVVDDQAEKKYTAFGTSFTLTSKLLDDALCEPIDLCFLYEYREPTLCVLANSSSPANPSMCKAKDCLMYQAFTLDLDQRARTPLFAVRGLPNDIFRSQPLSLPVGGSLLIGTNELIHIDQSGKSYAIAVNKRAKRNTSYSMSDESQLDLSLDASVIQQIAPHSSNLLIILENGDLAILEFRMEGRAMAGMKVYSVPSPRGGQIIGGTVSCATLISPNSVFVGCSQADSVLVNCTSDAPVLTHKRSHAEMDEGEDEDELLDDDEFDEVDELYGDDKSTKKGTASIRKVSADEMKFGVIDRLPNYAALGEPLFVKRRKLSSTHYASKNGSSAFSLELVLPTGCGRAGSLSFLSRKMALAVTGSMAVVQNARRVFGIATRSGSPKEATAAASASRESKSTKGPHDRYVMLSHADEDGTPKSCVLGLEDEASTDFEKDTETIFAGTLAGGSRIIQVSPTELRAYDEDFGLTEILPMADEESDEELTVVQASFCDPYLLLLRNDGSAFMLQVDEEGELKEVDRSGAILSNDWISGSLHYWSVSGAKATLYLLNKRGALYVFAASDLSKAVYMAEDLCHLPPILTASHSRRVPNPAVLVEILVADVGEVNVSSPYLIVRDEDDNNEVYQPFCASGPVSEHMKPETLRWHRVPCSSNGRSMASRAGSVDRGDARSLLTAFPNLNGYATVHIAGSRTRFVIRETRSDVRIVEAEHYLQSLCPLNQSQCFHGFAGIDQQGEVVHGTLPPDTRYGDIGWAVHRLPMQREVRFVVYHAPSDRYVLACSEPASAEESRAITNGNADNEEDLPSGIQGSNDTIQLLDPETFTIVDEHKLSIPLEQITCLTICSLQLAPDSLRHRTFVAVGTSQAIGEDGRALGSIYLFDIVPVVPDPDRKGTNLRLKLFTRAEMKGAVTSLRELDIHGLLVVAMGQKVQVRGLTDHETLLPTGFMDVGEDTSVLKTLKGTAMYLVGDIGKGLWFNGYQTEPYKLILFGRSRTELSVVAAEFMPFGKQLLFAVADADDNIHIFEYKPESPQSLSGNRLLHKSALHTAHPVQSMTLLPCTSPAPHMTITSNGTNGDTNGYALTTNGDNPTTTTLPPHQILITHTTGAISLLHPLHESTYRRLSTLQTYLTSTIEHPCGLNPRAYRAVDAASLAYAGAVQEGVGASGARTIVDGGLVGRWRELGVRGRAEAWGRVGGYAGGENEMAIGIGEVEVLQGGGLGFL